MARVSEVTFRPFTGDARLAVIEVAINGATQRRETVPAGVARMVAAQMAEHYGRDGSPLPVREVRPYVAPTYCPDCGREKSTVCGYCDEARRAARSAGTVYRPRG